MRPTLPQLPQTSLREFILILACEDSVTNFELARYGTHILGSCCTLSSTNTLSEPSPTPQTDLI